MKTKEALIIGIVLCIAFFIMGIMVRSHFFAGFWAGHGWALVMYALVKGYRKLKNG